MNESANVYLVNRGSHLIEVPIVNEEGKTDSIMVNPHSARGAQLAPGWSVAKYFTNKLITVRG